MKQRDFVILLLCIELLKGDDDTCSDSSTSEVCILAKLDTEEKLEEAFAAEAISYRIVKNFLRSRHPDFDRDITLCTQGSIDRLDRLYEQATAWHGSLSVALYLRPVDYEISAHDDTLARIRKLHEKVESQQKCKLSISLLYGVKLSEVPNEYDTLYPINALRNVAVGVAQTELIMVIDIDFIPSEGFWEFCTERELYQHLVSVSVKQRRVWALVSLELHETYLQLPRDKFSVAECLKNTSIVVAEAYLNPAAHMPVHIEQWLTKNEEYGPLSVGDGFEPFVLGSRRELPFYDERFRGYGWDKTTHAQHLVSLGFSYYMLPHHFVIARYHQPTATAVRIFGDAPDTLLRLRMEWLYNRFVTELADMGPHSPNLPRIANQTELATQAQSEDM